MVCHEDLSKRIFIHLKVFLSLFLLGCVMVSGEKKGFAIKTNGCLMVGWVKCELFSVKMKVIYSKSFLHPDQSSILGTYLNFIQFSLKTTTTTIFTWKDLVLHNGLNHLFLLDVKYKFYYNLGKFITQVKVTNWLLSFIIYQDLWIFCLFQAN